MYMKKGIIFLLVTAGVTIFFILLLQTKNSISSSAGSPTFESFGIQRFQGKKEAIAFSLKDLNGNQVALNDYRGKPMILFFWGSYCDACEEDIVLLEKFFEGKKDKLEILTIAIDGEREKRVKSVVKKNKITLPVLLDVKEKIARNYGVRMIPTTFLINREGWMEGMIVGQRDWCGPTALSAIKELFDLR
jgi:peroxiredoxin